MPKHTTRRRRMSKKKGGAEARGIPVVIFRNEAEEDESRLLFDSVDVLRKVLPELLAESRMSTYMDAIEKSGKTAAQVVEHLATKNAATLTLGNGWTVVKGVETMYTA